MEHIKAQLQLFRHWAKNGLKPFVRIEPKISHLDNKYFETKEIGKILFDNTLSSMHGDLSLKDILSLHLPEKDIGEFIRLHCPNLIKKLNSVL